MLELLVYSVLIAWFVFVVYFFIKAIGIPVTWADDLEKNRN